MKEIWLEKYRPQSLDDFLGQENVISSVKGFIENKKIPNIIMYGGPGTGKTSLVHIMIKMLFTPEERKERVLELNASDDRGIKVIRNVIKNFASYSISENSKSIPIKIIFLDEADSITLDSQFALRRVLEDYAKTTRFILSCNYLNKIIQPLISRCSVLNFQDFSDELLLNFINEISIKESLTITNPLNILNKCDRNLRKIINYLQSGYYKVDENHNIDWSCIIKQSNIDIHEKLFSYIYDGYQADYLIKSFSNWIIETQDNTKDLSDFFIKMTEIISNVSSKGTPIVNLTYIVLYYKSI